MKNQTHLAGLCGLAMLCGHAAQAQDAGFTWEGSVEIGVDSTVSSDDPTAEFSDVYLSIEAAFEAAITKEASILDCDLVAGDFDYLLRIRVSDIADFNRFHTQKLISLPGVRHARTFFVIKEVRANAPMDF